MTAGETAPATMNTKHYQDRVLGELRRATAAQPRSAAQLCERLGIRHGSDGTYSASAYREYSLVGRALQSLKRAGLVELVTGPGGGWRLSRKARRDARNAALATPNLTPLVSNMRDIGALHAVRRQGIAFADGARWTPGGGMEFFVEEEYRP